MPQHTARLWQSERSLASALAAELARRRTESGARSGAGSLAALPGSGDRWLPSRCRVTTSALWPARYIIYCVFLKYVLKCVLERPTCPFCPAAEVSAVKDYPIQTDQQLPLLLVSLRKARAMSQAELAERLGVTQQTISQMERNASSVTVQRLTKALSVLGAQLVLRDLKGPPSNSAAPETW